MQSIPTKITDHPELAALLTDFRAQLEATLGDSLLGLHLHGSLALGAFDPASSDIDFLAVTQGPLDSAQVAGLAAVHERLAERHPHWAAELEGSYVPLEDLQSLRPDNEICPGIERGGRLALCEQDLTYRVVHLYVL